MPEKDGTSLAPQSTPMSKQQAEVAGDSRRARRPRRSTTPTLTIPSDLPIPPQLTRQQMAVLHLVAAGLTNKQVAGQLGLSVHTVESHLHATYNRLEVATRGAAIRFAIEHNLG